MTPKTDSRAATSDKTLSLCHLAISSCADSEEQKKEEDRIAFSTHASSELDKIIKAANNAYEIQAASDVYMFSGIHADIENFLHAATPDIGYTTPDSHSKNGGIFTVGAARVGGAPTVGVLGPQQPSRPYRWHCRGGW